MAKKRVTLEDQHGTVVGRLTEEKAEKLESVGSAFWVAPRKMRLADRRHAGSSLDRRTAAAISGRQMEQAAGAKFAEAGTSERYQAARVRAWGETHDELAVTAGRRV